MSLQDLQKNDMMAHLIGKLEKKQDVGEYGRLVVAMVARHFVEEEQLVKLLAKNPNFDEAQARALVGQVQSRDYNPPKREKILQWQEEQGKEICPSGDPDACNVYK